METSSWQLLLPAASAAASGRGSPFHSLDLIMTSNVCCICANAIEGETPVDIVVSYPDGGTQGLWSHWSCLYARLHKSVPALPPEGIEETFPLLSPEQAYLAMFSFLERQFALTGSSDLGALLGSLALLPDGTPADPAHRKEWLAAVASAVAGDIDAKLQISSGSTE